MCACLRYSTLKLSISVQDEPLGWLVRHSQKSFSVFAATPAEREQWVAAIRRAATAARNRQPGRVAGPGPAALLLPADTVHTCMHCNQAQFSALNRKYHCKQVGWPAGGAVQCDCSAGGSAAGSAPPGGPGCLGTRLAPPGSASPATLPSSGLTYNQTQWRKKRNMRRTMLLKRRTRTGRLRRKIIGKEGWAPAPPVSTSSAMQGFGGTVWTRT